MELYTVGHSTQSQEDFIEMLMAYNINCIIDVRSMPYSRHASQFNQDILKTLLNKNNILYAHFGKEFGARRSDCLTTIQSKDGTYAKQVNFKLGAQTPDFKEGINRLDKALSQNRIISLMCTESNPLDCHRFSFISKYLINNGYNVKHILRDKLTRKIECLSHKELEDEMIQLYLSKKNCLLRKTEEQLLLEGVLPGLIESCTVEEQREEAYLLKNKEIGYIPEQPKEDIID